MRLFLMNGIRGGGDNEGGRLYTLSQMYTVCSKFAICSFNIGGYWPVSDRSGLV